MSLENFLVDGLDCPCGSDDAREGRLMLFDGEASVAALEPATADLLAISDGFRALEASKCPCSQERQMVQRSLDRSNSFLIDTLETWMRPFDDTTPVAKRTWEGHVDEYGRPEPPNVARVLVAAE